VAYAESLIHLSTFACDPDDQAVLPLLLRACQTEERGGVARGSHLREYATEIIFRLSSLGKSSYFGEFFERNPEQTDVVWGMYSDWRLSVKVRENAAATLVAFTRNKPLHERMVRQEVLLEELAGALSAAKNGAPGVSILEPVHFD
jgi:hypothetical protein